jgi:DNA-binding PadR family transcriptional regulator
MKISLIEIQNLSKHCNESLILSILLSGKKHGYQLALELEEKSNGMFKFNHGTLYPILHKLEKESLVRGNWEQEGPKRKRKYYTLTAKGRNYMNYQIEAWNQFYTHFFDIVGGE